MLILRMIVYNEIFLLYRGAYYDKTVQKDLLELIMREQTLDFTWTEDRLAIL